MTAGKEAAISRGSCQDSRTVSMNTCTVMKLWLTTSGAARLSSSRLPPACWTGISEGGDSERARERSAVSVLSTRLLLHRLARAVNFVKTGGADEGSRV